MSVMLSVFVFIAGASVGPQATATEPAVLPVQDGAPLCAGRARVELAGRGFDPGVIAQDTCFEDCDELPDISCNGNLCSAQNRDCSAGQQGYVVCDGNYTYCSEPCPECTDGELQFIPTGACCSDGSPRNELERYKCVNGQWVFDGYRCLGFCGPP